jgi:hypothetical protein
MRKILFTMLAAGALLAAVPVVSVAHDGEHRDRHRERERHHLRIHHERPEGIARRDRRRDAGSVSALAGGRLTIQLRDGARVAGAISRLTRVECDRFDSARSLDQRSTRSGPGSGGDRGGEDRGGGNDANDDHGHRGGRDHSERGCATIARGTRVRAAVLDVTGRGALWARIELGG